MREKKCVYYSNKRSDFCDNFVARWIRTDQIVVMIIENASCAAIAVQELVPRLYGCAQLDFRADISYPSGQMIILEAECQLNVCMSRTGCVDARQWSPEVCESLLVLRPGEAEAHCVVDNVVVVAVSFVDDRAERYAGCRM